MRLSILHSTARVRILRAERHTTNGEPMLTGRTAETALKAEQAKPQYSLALLNIVASEALPLKSRLAAALAFKNFIRNNYVVRRGPRSAHPHTSRVRLADRHLERGWKLQTTSR